jgi:5'-methylthioadenosine phosphorylase
VSAALHREQPIRTAIVSGSGIYSLTGMQDVDEVRMDTPFGEPSAAILLGTLAGERVAFLARHGKNHRLLPSEINYRANIFALKQLGVERILSVSAVGSLQEQIRPRDVVLIDQFIDRTVHRPATFFGDGVAVHVSLADPICGEARGILAVAARKCGARVHDGGTYVCIEGPAFSTRAESRMFRSWNTHVVGMTNMQEARLAREAEICYATMALVTDFDCWHDEEADVTVGAVLEHLEANQSLAARILLEVVARMPARGGGCSCADALRDAIITPREAIPEAARRRLRPILGRYLDDPS